MVDINTFLGYRPTEYPEEFKEFLKNNFNSCKQLSYANMFNNNTKFPPLNLFTDTNAMDNPVFEFSDTKESIHNKANMPLVKLAKKFFPALEFDAYKITFNLLTNTTPIQINLYKDDKQLPESLFVKHPDTNRVVGNYLYNIVGENKNFFLFNEDIFAINEIKGNTINKVSEDVYLASKEYKEEIVRSYVQASFMGLGDISSQYDNILTKRNRLITPDQKIKFIDFGNLFRGPNANLLINYKDKKDFLTDVLDAYVDEHKQIVSRVEENQEDFFNFLEVAGEVKDITKKTINERIKQYYGSQNVMEHYERLIDDYSKM